MSERSGANHQQRAVPGWAGAVGAVARRPGLWPALARQARRLAPARWWRRPPFLPVPDRAWLRFRLETQYGGHARPDPHDVVVWLAWAGATDRRNRPSPAEGRR